MYSDKKNILQLTALLKEHNITNVVLCPGSRNAPIIQTLVNHPFFTCHAVTDERSAGFFAMGLAIQTGRPVAVCCTSGSALLNIHPAVAEAFYQQVPLIVISADRPAAWIGQMDGQTLPQPNVFGPLVKKSVNLPEVFSDEDEWYCNRLINEALLESDHRGCGPIHINIPVSDPLFLFSVEKLPDVRVISRYIGFEPDKEKYARLVSTLKKYEKRMLITGQMTQACFFAEKACGPLSNQFIWLSEHISNQMFPGKIIKNFDALIYSLAKEQQEQLIPDIIITYGGHVVSKRLKKFLREHPPKEHWHVSESGEIVDLYGAVTTIIETDPFEFLLEMGALFDNTESEYSRLWKDLSYSINEPELPYSEVSAIGLLIKSLPENSVLHLGNSSSVRYAQFFTVPDSVEVYCNRGTSGIEGTLSTAVGFASASTKINFVIIGDLSFFYDMNALWNGHIKNNLRILLLNNGGGEIFQTLPGLNLNERTHHFISATHHTSAKGWAIECGFDYIPAHDNTELTEAMQLLTSVEPSDKPILLEVFTDQATDVNILKEYLSSLKNNK